MDEDEEEKDFAELLGISKPDERKIKSLVVEAFEKTSTTEDAILFLCGKNGMEMKSVFAGFCAGIGSTMALLEMGKIPVAIAIAVPVPVPVPTPVPVKIPDDKNVYHPDIAA